MLARYQVLLPEYVECWIMDADGFSIVDNRAGITFGVELYVPWNASAKRSGCFRNGWSSLSTESRVLQGRDARSI